MIKSVTVTNYVGDSLKISLSNPWETGILISDIDGIGPGSGTINTTEVATRDGTVFNSSRVGERNIVFKFQYMEVPTVEDVRLKVYKYFPIKHSVNLVFDTTTRSYQIDGYVESNDPDIFSSAESAQISIICPSYYFRNIDGDTNVFSFAAITSMFEFPFSNESLTDTLLIMSDIDDQKTHEIIYDGLDECGIKMTIHILGTAKNISIADVLNQETFSIKTDTIKSIVGSELQATDDIVITTYTGNKTCKLIRNAVEYNILNAVDRYSDWFKLQNGFNKFVISADEGLRNLQFSIEYDSIYTGI